MLNKMAFRFLIFFLLFFVIGFAHAKDTYTLGLKEHQILIAHLNNGELKDSLDVLETTFIESEVKFKRGKAIIFTVLTGIFGGHRIYLGTRPRTAILYSVTLGGLGVLPLIDLIHLIFVKDISRYNNNQQVFMWSGK